MYTTSLERLADFYGVDPAWLATGEGDRRPSIPGGDFLDALKHLEERVEKQERTMNRLTKTLDEDPRWQQVEERLNFLSERMRRYAIEAKIEDGQGESPQWSPIDLNP